MPHRLAGVILNAGNRSDDGQDRGGTGEAVKLFRLSEGLIDLLKGLYLTGFQDISGLWEMRPSYRTPDTFEGALPAMVRPL
jgi:hypothetical protein